MDIYDLSRYIARVLVGENLRNLIAFIWILIPFLGFSFSTTIRIPFSIDDGAIYDPRGYIYAFSGRSMMVLDVSNPLRIDYRTFKLERYYESGVVCDRKLYIYGERNLFVYDVKEPFHPKLLKNIAGIYGADALVCAEGIVYAIGDEYIHILKDTEIITEIHSGVVVKNRWWKSGKHLFVQREGGGFVVIDISDRYSPKIVRVFKGYGSTVGSGKWAYSVSPRELLVIDVSNPVSPETVNITDMQKVCNVIFRKGNVTSYPVIRGVEIVGEYLVVIYTWDEDWVAFLSLKDPSKPKLVKKEKIIDEGDFTNITLSDGKRYLYIFHFEDMLTIYRLEIRGISEIRFPERSKSALVAFIGGGDGWLRILSSVKVYVDGECIKRLQMGQSVEVSGGVIGISLDLSDGTVRYYYFYLPDGKSCLIKIRNASESPYELVEYECKALR